MSPDIMKNRPLGPLGRLALLATNWDITQVIQHLIYHFHYLPVYGGGGDEVVCGSLQLPQEVRRQALLLCTAIQLDELRG